MADTLDKLAECLEVMGIPYETKGDYLSFFAQTVKTGEEYQVFAEERLPSQVHVYTDYFPPFRWDILPKTKHFKYYQLLAEFTKRNNYGVYYKTDSRTGETIIEGVFLADGKDCQNLRRLIVGLGRLRENLETDFTILFD